MSKFTSAGLCEQLIWTMRLADLPRGTNRAMIDRLANGLPPYSKQEQEKNRVAVNVNWLEFPELLADAKRTYFNAFLKPGQFFTVRLEQGPIDKRGHWENQISHHLNRVMKQNRQYVEFLKNQFASTVLHGVGSGFWMDRDRWYPRCVGMEDILIPSDTLLTMENLSHFAIFRQFTPMELRLATSGKNSDPAWQMDVVEAALDWADKQWWKEQSYSSLYAPQKVEDRWKQDLGWYGTDCVPTIDAWDFYFWSNEGGREGWRRRMILDTPPGWQVGSKAPKRRQMPEKNLIGDDHGKWLYNPGDERVYQDKLDSIIHFQFADASSVAPFKYHSVRSLGWMLYSVCHLQNRLRCSFNDALFEAMKQYFRTSNPDDHERITKVDLHDRGVVPDGVTFVRPEERWQVNQQLVELGLSQNMMRMQASAAQYREGRAQDTDRREKTATQIMAEVNSANALVGSMLMQAYMYQSFQYREIARRFCQKNSVDQDVREFRNAILKVVPEEYIDATMWTIEPERVLGAGNKILQVAMADKLMSIRPQLDPEAQRKVDRIYVEANSDKPELVESLVPSEPNKITSSVHDAQLMFGTLMQGIPVMPYNGQNASEIIETLIASLGVFLQQFAQGIAPTQRDVVGMGTVVAAIQVYLQQLAQDKNQKPKVQQITQVLGQITQQIDALAKQVAQSQPQPVNGEAMKEQAKAQAMVIQAQNKAALTAESHAQRTQQRDVQFRMQMQHDAEKHQQDMMKKAQETEQELATNRAMTVQEMAHSAVKSVQENEQATKTAAE